MLSDEHKSYPGALREQGCRIRHEVTSSRRPRDRGNALWEINLVDGLIRHSQAGHRRQTWAAPKRRGESAGRLAIFLVWRNYLKWRREKGCRQTPAMVRGLLERRLEVADVLKERLFRTRIGLPPRWAAYYDRLVRTPVLGVNRRHELRYAY